MCHYIKNNKVIILLEKKTNAGTIKTQHLKKAGASHWTIEDRSSPLDKARIVT
jgi:hypothetical protein